MRAVSVRRHYKDELKGLDHGFDPERRLDHARRRYARCMLKDYLSNDWVGWLMEREMSAMKTPTSSVMIVSLVEIERHGESLGLLLISRDLRRLQRDLQMSVYLVNSEVDSLNAISSDPINI